MSMTSVEMLQMTELIQTVAYQHPQRLVHGLHSMHCFRLTLSRHFDPEAEKQAIYQVAPAALSDGVLCLELAISEPDL